MCFKIQISDAFCVLLNKAYGKMNHFSEEKKKNGIGIY